MVLFTISCGKEGRCIAAFGDTASEFRELTGIKSIKVGEKFDVVLTCDSAEKEGIKIQYSEKLIDGVSATIENGQLILIDENRCNWLRNLQVRIPVKVNVRSLESIHLEGSATIDCRDTIPGTELRVMHNSVGLLRMLGRYGNIYGQSMNTGGAVLAGKGGIFSWSNENGSWVDARNLRAEDAYLFHYTQRDCYLQGRLIMDIKIYGSGNVYYKYPPQVRLSKEEKGEGRLLVF